MSGGRSGPRTREQARIVEFSAGYTDRVLEFEKRLREEEPDTYYWEPDEEYRRSLERSFHDERFKNAVSFLALRGDKVTGRIDASLIASRCDAVCASAYLDWICVLKSERHSGTAQRLLEALRGELRSRNVATLIALMARNTDAQRFYRSVEGAQIHDEGIWISV